ncbi:Transmembrane protein 87B [Camellia lanceoleosa]|uniref:Transmembrane protein 87B n=1 Tax=Camellia lanceoleosa TaxID=1840588 RepID=A0ACC0HTN4_9ERIC|nr:Transmembrane protein 87B [Camellia lanceoleosa]
MQSGTGLVETIIVEVKDRERIGGAFLKSDAICCTPELSQDKSCKVGEVIIHKNLDNPEWPKRIQTFFEGTRQEAKMTPQNVEIQNTGMYYLYFMFCDPELKGTVIRGRTVWRNPEGYLPGKMVPMMTFYGIVALAYLVLGLMWFLRFVQFWKDIIQLHYHITAVIALGMCETALWYFEYANLNATGSRPMGITLWVVTISVVKKTLSRLLLLVVSMGYGVVKPTLGGVTSRVLLLDIFGASCCFLDSWFILWIFSALSKTLEKLQMRRSMVKLELYRKFTNSLAVFVLLSIGWIGYELYFNASDPLSELWQFAWIIPAFWTLLALSLLVVICVLWAPSSNPTRYAYAGDTADDFDEEAISLTSAVKVSGATEHVTGLSEDLEEDKRE